MKSDPQVERFLLELDRCESGYVGKIDRLRTADNRRIPRRTLSSLQVLRLKPLILSSGARRKII